MSRVGVIGAGYVGLATTVTLTHLGHDVTCAEIDPGRLAILREGKAPILEAGLEDLLQDGLERGILRFVPTAAEAVEGAEFVFLCVQTPMGDDGRADLSFIEGAAAEIASVLETGSIVITKSTVPVGSSLIVQRVLQRGDVSVVSSPEFLQEGTAVHDSLHPHRIVIGTSDQAAAIRVDQLFAGIQAPRLVTDPPSAETIKYASNSFLATKISFANAVAALCEAVGADVGDVLLGMGYDPRIGFEFLRPGPGWGGSCLLGDETVLVRRDARIRLMRIADLFGAVVADGAVGIEVLSWRVGAPVPEFLPAQSVTARPYRGEVVTVTTKMGRRVTATADHPFVVANGQDERTGVRLADELTTEDWLPLAQGLPFIPESPPAVADILESLPDGQIEATAVIARLGAEQAAALMDFLPSVPTPRRWDVKRSKTLRLNEMRDLGITTSGGAYATVTNGTYVPSRLALTEDFWRMVGLYLAEGWVSRDQQRERIQWAFHPSLEDDLVEFVAGYWRNLGVKASVHCGTFTKNVSVSSRILAAWLKYGLGVGVDASTKRIPDLAWSLGEAGKKALLRGLWDGDGSWSKVRGGPSVVYEYGTASRELADGMLRLLADLGVVARLKVGRVAKSTGDFYWLVVSGADQIEQGVWLFPESERLVILESIAKQRKRIKPTGYRPLSKNVAWVRVTSTERRHYEGLVYSMEVPEAHTFVTSFGLVVHNCFPKDVRALKAIGDDNGYDFALLQAVIDVNEEQFERVVEKIATAAGHNLKGKRIAVLGLAFKARTSDTRSSPSLEVSRRLLAAGASVRAYDPVVSSVADDVTVCADAYAACEGADVLAVLTEWDEFRWLDFDKVGSVMAQRSVVDARNLLDPPALRRLGFVYEGIGR